MIFLPNKRPNFFPGELERPIKPQMAALAESYQVYFSVIGGVVVDVMNGQHNSPAGKPMSAPIPGSAQLTPIPGLINDKPAYLFPVRRIKFFSFRSDWHD
ncbi:MAG: hypothetical protein QHH14_11350 [Clostridiales bacterium]|nr:hypothetical protein [Clostridiales bacterium]